MSDAVYIVNALLEDDDEQKAELLKEPRFKEGERVRVLGRPDGTSSKRPLYYGRIGAVVTKGGMWLAVEDRESRIGEPAYTVYFTPKGGALWWSENYLLPVRSRVVHEAEDEEIKAAIERQPPLGKRIALFAMKDDYGRSAVSADGHLVADVDQDYAHDFSEGLKIKGIVLHGEGRALTPWNVMYERLLAGEHLTGELFVWIQGSVYCWSHNSTVYRVP